MPGDAGGRSRCAAHSVDLLKGWDLVQSDNRETRGEVGGADEQLLTALLYLKRRRPTT